MAGAVCSLVLVCFGQWALVCRGVSLLPLASYGVGLGLFVLTQLKVGGRLVAIVGDEPIMHAQVITRTSETNFKADEKWDDNAPCLLNFPKPSTFVF